MMIVAKQYCMPLLSRIAENSVPIGDFQRFDENWTRRRFKVFLADRRQKFNLFQEWMELDLHYIDHWPFWLDVKVKTKSIPAVLKAGGAA
jgi:hypothetical protein